MTTQGRPPGSADVAEQRLLRIEDIAERLAVSRSMAWKLIAQGQLRSIRIGRSVRVRPSDLEAYVADALREA
ncbi:MAG: helix-turn-helix transcriptional regulator [Solirubrobacterales bacterium]